MSRTFSTFSNSNPVDKEIKKIKNTLISYVNEYLSSIDKIEMSEDIYNTIQDANKFVALNGTKSQKKQLIFILFSAFTRTQSTISDAKAEIADHYCCALFRDFSNWCPGIFDEVLSELLEENKKKENTSFLKKN